MVHMLSKRVLVKPWSIFLPVLLHTAAPIQRAPQLTLVKGVHYAHVTLVVTQAGRVYIPLPGAVTPFPLTLVVSVQSQFLCLTVHGVVQPEGSVEGLQLTPDGVQVLP